MASEEEDSPSYGSSSPAASTSQEPQATPLDASENLKCPICHDTIHDQASVSWCGHLFCYDCILEWSRRRAVCPICRGRFYYIYRKVGDDTYVVYDIEPSTSSTSHAREGTPGPHSAERNRHHSPGRQPRRDRGGGRAEALERGRSRSPRQHDDGPSRVQHAQGYEPSSSSRRPQSRAQDAARNTARDEAQAPRPERQVPVSSGRTERHRWEGQVSIRERQATRSRSRHRSRSPWRQTWREQERRRDHRHGRALRPEEQVPAYPTWSDRHQREEGASVREPQASRSRPRQISRTPERPTRWEQPRRRDLYEGRALGPERQVPVPSRRTERHRWEGQASIRERQATRSRSRHRSRSPWRQTWQEQERRRDHHQGRALRPEEQVQARSRWSDRHQREGGASVREQQATSSRSRHRSRSPWRQTWWEQERRRDHEEGRALRPEEQVPASSRQSARRQREGRGYARDVQATRSRSRRRSRSPAWRHTWREQERRRDRVEGRALSPEEQVPASSRQSARRQREGRGYARDVQATRSRSRRRSRSPWRQTRREQERRRDHEEGRALSPEEQVPASSRRSARRQREGRGYARDRQATRSRSRRRSRSPAWRRAS